MVLMQCLFFSKKLNLIFFTDIRWLAWFLMMLIKIPILGFYHINESYYCKLKSINKNFFLSFKPKCRFLIYFSKKSKNYFCNYEFKKDKNFWLVYTECWVEKTHEILAQSMVCYTGRWNWSVLMDKVRQSGHNTRPELTRKI